MCNQYPGKPSFHRSSSDLKELISASQGLKDHPVKFPLLSNLSRLEKLEKHHTDFQLLSEQSSLFLNEHSLSEDLKRRLLFKSWVKFPAISDRSTTATGLRTPCIEKPDPKFKQYMKTILPLLRELFRDFKQGQGLLQGLDQVDFFPAGSQTMFGATADYSKEKSRICINPEESTPFLVSKIMHELTHALNIRSRTLLKSFNQKIQEWNQVSSLTENAEQKLYDFEAHIKDDAKNPPDTDSIMDSFRTRTKADEKDFLKVLRSKKEAYKKPEPRIQEHAKIFQEWHQTIVNKKTKNQELLEARKNLDQERFIDEHRAYLIEYQSALFLVKQDPQFYCRLWAPSYAKGRPALFYETYLSLEKKFTEGQFSSWLADLYTEKSKSYMPESVYQFQSGKNTKIIRADLLKIIRDELPESQSKK